MSPSIHGIPILDDNYAWLIVRDCRCIIVDPGESGPIIHFLNQHKLIPTAILVTHHHWDHTDGIKDILSIYPSTQVVTAKHEPVEFVSHTVKDHDKLLFDNFPVIDVITTPGHTRYHCAYHIDKMLFTGDTLFSAGCGRVFEVEPETLWTSLEKLRSLPDETLVFAGHEYTLNNLIFAHHVLPDNPDIEKALDTCKSLRNANVPTLPSQLSTEKKINIFLMSDKPSLWQQLQHKIQIHDAYTCFKFLRKWKNDFFSGNMSALD